MAARDTSGGRPATVKVAKRGLAAAHEDLIVRHEELKASYQSLLAARDALDARIAALTRERSAATTVARRHRDRADRFEAAAVTLVTALRKMRHDQARALTEQRDRLRNQLSFRIGSAVTGARSLPRMLALPMTLARERKAFQATRDPALPPPAVPRPLEPGALIAGHEPSFLRLRLQADKALFLGGQVIGSDPVHPPQLEARVRYLNASGRLLQTGSATQPVTSPVAIRADRRFSLAFPNPAEAALAEVAFVTARGDVAFVGLDVVQQPKPETAARWLVEGHKKDMTAAPIALPASRGGSGAVQPVLTAEERARQAARREIRHNRIRLLSLGFGERAVHDLRAMAEDETHPYRRLLAAWELVSWHADRYTPEDARRCLEILPMIEANDVDPDAARRCAVLKAECLELTGDFAGARKTLEDAIAIAPHADLYFGLTRLAPDIDGRLAAINTALALHDLPLASLTPPVEGGALYDRLHAEAPAVESTARVSIIIPAFNAGPTIGTAIRSLLDQSWRDVEILISDDCSTDDTVAVVEEFVRRDPRVKLIRGEPNAGPYVARNLALGVATGAFVTCNDSDDWSHPQKIAVQAQHLIDNPDVVANTSPQARASEDLVFHRRGNAGFYLQPNMSSLMFRREQVVSRIGYWDSVRFAADSEFTRRIKATFGRDAIFDLDCGPMSFQRQTETSLTGSAAFGYSGFKMGARREYEESHRRFHRAGGEDLYVGFPLSQRLFPAPEPMLPDRARDRTARRHFDIIMVSDFRLPGGTNMSNVEEIKAQSRLGLTTGLVQMSLYHLNPERSANPKVAEQLEAGAAEMIVFGEKVSCDLLIVRLPWVLEDWQAYIPDVEAQTVRVIVNQPPQRDYGPDAEALADFSRCADHLKAYFGKDGSWHPIGPLVRDALLTHHAEEMKQIDLGPIWANIIDVSEWRRPARPARRGRTRIVRHSRDQYVKWPSSVEELLQIYPDDPAYEVHVLGGADTPKALLGGRLPRNWTVTEFGKRSPQRFLAQGDVFVYFTHPDWIESFGRVIFEAMAVGLPVILPPVYQELFQDAAIYCQPHEVTARIDALMADDDAYDRQVERALAYVEQHFGYAQHAQRIGHAMGRDLAGAPVATTTMQSTPVGTPKPRTRKAAPAKDNA